MEADLESAMRFQNGYLTLFVANGVSVRGHWSLPIPLLLFLGSQEAQGFGIAWALIVIVHELGHAWLARRYGLPVLSLDFHALGGCCAYGGYPTPMQTSVIAWGGVLGQALLVAGAVLADYLFPAKSLRASTAISALGAYNAFVALFNLIPHRALDGGRAWKLLPMMWSRWRARRRARAGIRRLH